MTLKQYVDRFFEERLERDDYTGQVDYDEFYGVWDFLHKCLKQGVLCTFEGWHDEYDDIDLPADRKAVVVEAIDNYIRNKLKKHYDLGV